MRGIIGGLLAAVLAGNGAAMLAAGAWWYATVPGVTQTGPYNPHFVKDIGAAYLVCAAAVVWRIAWPATAWSASVAVAAFLGLHGVIHLADSLGDPAPLADLLRDAPGVFIPALLAAWIAWPSNRSPAGGRTDA